MEPGRMAGAWQRYEQLVLLLHVRNKMKRHPPRQRCYSSLSFPAPAGIQGKVTSHVPFPGHYRMQS